MGNEQHVVIHTGTVAESGEYRFEVLRYPSLASAQAMFIDQSVVYTCAQDFEDRMSMAIMRTLASRVLREKYDKRHLPPSKSRRAEYLWTICLAHARPHNPRAKTKGARAEKRADTRYRVSLLYLEDPLIAHTPMPPQMRHMIGYFVSYMSPDGIDEEGVEMLIRNMHDEGLLVTTQDPVRIWRYYKQDMISRCLLELI